jgi:hypothetical protein
MHGEAIQDQSEFDEAGLMRGGGRRGVAWGNVVSATRSRRREAVVAHRVGRPEEIGV